MTEVILLIRKFYKKQINILEFVIYDSYLNLNNGKNYVVDPRRNRFYHSLFYLDLYFPKTEIFLERSKANIKMLTFIQMTNYIYIYF